MYSSKEVYKHVNTFTIWKKKFPSGMLFCLINGPPRKILFKIKSHGFLTPPPGPPIPMCGVYSLWSLYQGGI